MSKMIINEEKNSLGVITYSISGKAGRHEFYRFGNYLNIERAGEVAKDLKLYAIGAPLEIKKKKEKK